MTLRLSLVMVGTSAALVISACTGAKDESDGTVRAILAEPIASFVPRDVRVLRSFSLEGDNGFPEASSAFLSRLFAVSDQAYADAAQRSLRRRAEATGWDTHVRASGDLVVGWKQLGPPDHRFWAELTIGDLVDKGTVRVTVRIEDCACSPSR